MAIQDLFDEQRERTLRIHAILKANQNNPDLRMGVPFRSCWNELTGLIRESSFRESFRKPFLMRNRSWVRKIVIADPNAFSLLAPHIKLELLVEGELRYWNGYGSEITRKPDDPLDFLQDKLGPYLLEFLLGENSILFSGVLKNL